MQKPKPCPFCGLIPVRDEPGWMAHYGGENCILENIFFFRFVDGTGGPMRGRVHLFKEIWEPNPVFEITQCGLRIDFLNVVEEIVHATCKNCLKHCSDMRYCPLCLKGCAGMFWYQSAGEKDTLKSENERLKNDLEEAVGTMRGLVDDEDCSLDHHGYCQTHGLEENCSNARGRQFLSRFPVENKKEDGK